MSQSSPEKGSQSMSTPERGAALVQPSKAEGLALLVAEIGDIPSENSGEGPGENWSQGGGQMTTTGGQQGQHTSARDQAIANLPVAARMQQVLEAHIRNEVKALRKEANRITRSRKPGSAYALAELYGKIRRLNALLAELLEASFDVLKRLFIRVFIDKQAIG